MGFSFHGGRSFGLRGVLIGQGAIVDAGGIFCAELKPRDRDVKAKRVSLTGDPTEPPRSDGSIGPIKLAIKWFDFRVSRDFSSLDPNVFFPHPNVFSLAVTRRQTLASSRAHSPGR